jgi:uncharacterized lipoprotein YmbA
VRLASLLVWALLGGCVLNRPDHFYVLDPGHPAELPARSAFAMQVNLRVSLPTLVDRSELVLTNPKGVAILEHERWAAPLTDQFTRVLGQDIEARREDIILASRSIAQPGVRTASIALDVVELSLQKGADVRMEVRWRLQRGESEHVSQGRETFVSTAPDGSFDGLARSLSACIGLLADRLVAQLPDVAQLSN